MDMGAPHVPEKLPAFVCTENEIAIDTRAIGLVKNTFIVQLGCPDAAHVSKPIGFIYHPHLRLLTTPIAALASLSATLHSHAPSLLLMPSCVLHTLARTQSPDLRSPSPAPSHTNTPLPSALHTLATTLELSPIHVDHLAEAVCMAIEQQDVRGPAGLRRMWELIGWGEREHGG
ncbi:hypothetical protein JB92DRAFT_3145142 [Gautieria morchelliformis]|nr:hypothetical protein JB92DRAFT_3145142 [Gautieria morchelliformis]